MGKIYRIVYASSARWHMEEIELQEILRKARRYNEQHGISGLLLYADGNFLQILEGGKQQVEHLYMKISADNRHNGIIRLISQTSDTRSFPDWSMGYHKISREELEQNVPGFNSIFKCESTSEEIRARVSSAVWTLLCSFRQIVNV